MLGFIITARCHPWRWWNCSCFNTVSDWVKEVVVNLDVPLQIPPGFHSWWIWRRQSLLVFLELSKQVLPLGIWWPYGCSKCLRQWFSVPALILKHISPLHPWFPPWVFFICIWVDTHWSGLIILYYFFQLKYFEMVEVKLFLNLLPQPSW